MADMYDPIKRVESIGEETGIEKITPEQIEPKNPANKDYFDSLMAQERNKESLQVQKADEARTSNSLIDEVRELNSKVDGWKINVEKSDLIAQAQDASKQMETIKDKLASPDLEIRAPVQRLLNRKLSHIDESLKIALDKAGLEYKDIQAPTVTATAEAGKYNPVDKLLGFLSHGQKQLDTLASEVANLESPTKEMSPANMLAIQIKVNYVQQELELFTNLLNKSLESTKTLMNVQV
jgi:hypothetical protein